MEVAHERQLEDLHHRLMEEVESGEDSISKDLATGINNLGVYTQEILTNAEDSVGLNETALSAACRLAKPRTVCQLLHLQAIPTLKVYRSLMSNSKPENRAFIASQLLMFTKPRVRLRVLWMACLFNEVDVAKICLNDPYIDSNVAMSIDAATAIRGSWTFSEPPLPIQYAANQNYKSLVEILERYHDYDKHAANDFYVDHLLIAAYKGHRALAEHILNRRGSSAEQYAIIYEILGASEIIANNPAVGKALWKEVIVSLELAGSFKSRMPNDILCLEPHIQDFRTRHEIDAMRAKELRIQALGIMRRYYRNNYLFADALLRREYSNRISVFTLEFLSNQDRMSATNLKIVATKFEQLGFFKFPDSDLILKCLRWTIQFVGHLRQQLDVRPQCMADFDRLSALVDFTCRILFCVELLEDYFDEGEQLLKVEVNHILRKVVSVFQPWNKHCCLLDQLHCMSPGRMGARNIFNILQNAGADLIVSDAAGNVVRDYAADLPQEDSCSLWAKEADGSAVITVINEN